MSASDKRLEADKQTALRAVSESSLVAACLELLARLGVPCLRNNTGALRVAGRFVRFGAVGSSDILGTLPPRGRTLAIEAKTERGRLSEAQAAFLERIRAAGGVGVVIRPSDFPGLLEQIVERERAAVIASERVDGGP